MFMMSAMGTVFSPVKAWFEILLENPVVMSGPGVRGHCAFVIVDCLVIASVCWIHPPYGLIFLLSVTSSMSGGCGCPPTKVGLIVNSAPESFLQREMAVPYHPHYLTLSVDRRSKLYVRIPDMLVRNLQTLDQFPRLQLESGCIWELQRLQHSLGCASLDGPCWKPSSYRFFGLLRSNLCAHWRVSGLCCFCI